MESSGAGTGKRISALYNFLLVYNFSLNLSSLSIVFSEGTWKLGANFYMQMSDAITPHLELFSGSFDSYVLNSYVH